MVTVGEVLNSVLFVFLQVNEENCKSSPCESAEYLQELTNLYLSHHGSTLIPLLPLFLLHCVQGEGTGEDCPQNNPCLHRVAPPRAAELGPDVCSHGRKADFCCPLGGDCCSQSELQQLKSSCALGCRHSHCLPSLVHGQSCLQRREKLKGAHQTLWITTPGCPKASQTSSLWLNFPCYHDFGGAFMGQEGMCSVGGGVPLRK